MKKLFSFLSLLFVISNVNAQSELKVFPDWYGSNGTQNFFYKNETKVDASNNIYIAGATLNGSGNYDILLVKYNSSGVVQWTVQYNGDGNWHDMATGLYIDGSGNVYITGFTTTSTGVDLVTIKYNSSGTQQWLRTYNGNGNWYDSGADITGDGSGNIYVTGSIYYNSTLTDAITIKYNSSGTQQWAKLYYVAGKCVAGVKLVVNVTGVVVSSLVQMDSVTYRYGVLLYNQTTGNLISSTVSGSSTTGIDQVNDMVQDASGNIYIVGATPVTGHGLDLDVIKLNSSLGIAWERTYNGADSLDDVGKGIVVDASGNVFVTGYKTTSNQGKDIITIKYNSSGTQQWIETYNDTLNMDDEGSEMAIDPNGNIYVTGYTTTEIDSTDYYTIKYNTSGDELWSIKMDGLAHLNDKADNIAIDNNGDIIVTGVSQTATGFLYKAVKYIEKQVITPTDYNSESPQSNFLFYANQGQLIGTNDTLVPYIKYYSNTSPPIYIKYSGYSLVFGKTDTIANTPDSLQRIDVSFQRANSNSKPLPLEEQNSFFNYYLSHCQDGRTEIRGNKRIVCQNIYNNIDLMYSSNQHGIKFYYIVKPGADPTNISIVYTGATSFYLNGSNNELTINGIGGNSITYERPTVYQIDNMNNIININGWTADWQTNGSNNIYKFNIGSYDNSKTLIIQVDEGHTQLLNITNGNLDWSTNYGNNGGTFQPDNDNYGLDITTNSANGGSFVVGKTNSSNFPYTVGTIPVPNSGIYNGYILSFNQNADREWATVIGGDDDLSLNSVTQYSGKLFATGTTTCSDLPYFPSTTPNTYNKGTNSGGKDALILQINTINGNIAWSSYIGGAGDDDSRSITIDKQGSVYIAGNTTSTALNNNNCLANTLTAFPLCNPGNCYYQNFNAGGQDIFITKFDMTKHLVWSTLYGSDGDDYVFEINYLTGSPDYIILAGNTTKSSDPQAQYNGGCRTDGNFPLCNSTGTDDFFQVAGPNYKPTIGFIGKFTTSGQETWATNMWNIYEFQTVTSNNNNFYVAGYTNGVSQGVSSCEPISPSQLYTQVPICDENNGYANYYPEDQLYIAKFNKNTNHLTWSTLYPGWTDIYSLHSNLWAFDPSVAQIPERKTIDITSDNLSNIYLLGTGVRGIYTQQSTPNGAYFQDFDAGTLSDITDTYILNFNDNNELIWATYFGTDATIEASYYYNYPNFSDWCGAIVTHSTKYLYITGYTGCGFPEGSNSNMFPWANQTGNSNAYVYKTGTNGNNFEAFISRFNLASIGVGIQEPQNNESLLHIYPNPTITNNITITFPFIKNGNYQVFNMLGEVLLSGEVNSTDKIEIYANNFEKGCYIVKISWDEKCQVGKFIKY